jgi:hypothetical protein
MSIAAATASARAAQPDLTRAGTRASATRNAVAILISVVFNLIAYARPLSLTVRSHRRDLNFDLTSSVFATRNIHTTATQCLRDSATHSVALDKALWRRASRALRVWLPGLRRDRTPLDQRGANIHAGAAAGGNAPAQATPAQSSQTRAIADLPTQPQAADQARRPWAGSLDGGIPPANAGSLWDERRPVRCFGDSLKQFIAEVDWCKAPAARFESPRFEAPPEHHRPGSLSAEEQSRDHAPPQAASAEWSLPQAGPCPETCEPFAQTETAPAKAWPVSLPSTREAAAAASP